MQHEARKHVKGKGERHGTTAQGDQAMPHDESYEARRDMRKAWDLVMPQVWTMVLKRHHGHKRHAKPQAPLTSQETRG